VSRFAYTINESCSFASACFKPFANLYTVSHKPFIVKVDGKSGLHSFKNFIVILLICFPVKPCFTNETNNDCKHNFVFPSHMSRLKGGITPYTASRDIVIKTGSTGSYSSRHIDTGIIFSSLSLSRLQSYQC
jgi:hypothetical protein